ncbi:uncharacterized protein LOC120130144 [Hibiscus syriacus]|uniref:uncharacterized protein LOC120130144 n=1 Tax=Hibiscus syriacus TaxID=106335 RepID=UPI0019216AAE|nr:uncharacterized protein LOC120130144 [Hibiscus syriacus]
MYYNSSCSRESRRFARVCDHCDIRGYKKDSCYRLHGFPPGFKFTKKKPSYGNLVASSQHVELDTGSGVGGSSAMAAIVFTREQYNQLLELLNRPPPVEPTTKLAGTVSHGTSRDFLDTRYRGCRPQVVYFL